MKRDARFEMFAAGRRAAVATLVAALCAGGAQAALAVDSQFDNKTMDTTVSYAQTYFTAADDSLMGEHRALGLTCIDCHQTSDGTAPEAANPAGKRATCMQNGCHDNWDAVEQSTSDWAGKVTVYNPTGIYNPHANHRGDADCGDCHKMHSTQTLTCAQCHDITVPSGWEGYY